MSRICASLITTNWRNEGDKLLVYYWEPISQWVIGRYNYLLIDYYLYYRTELSGGGSIKERRKCAWRAGCFVTIRACCTNRSSSSSSSSSCCMKWNVWPHVTSLTAKNLRTRLFVQQYVVVVVVASIEQKCKNKKKAILHLPLMYRASF